MTSGIGARGGKKVMRLKIVKMLSRRAHSGPDTGCYMQGNLKIPAPRLAFLQANSSRHFVYGW
jgi:hypothetical protein